MKKRPLLLLWSLVIILIGVTLFYGNPIAFLIEEIRLPRLCMLLLIATMLGLSGYLLQRVTGNDLADPSILGINQGSGLAIACTLSLLSTTMLPTLKWLPLLAIIGGGVAANLLFILSVQQRRLNVSLLVLNGIGLNALLASVMLLVINRTKDGLKIDFMMKWLMGNLWSFEWPQIYVLALVLFVSIVVILYYQRELAMFILQEEQQQLLGVPYQVMRFVFIGLAVVMTSLAVAYGGGLTFIGLLAPHMARYFVPQSERKQLIATMLFSMILIMTSDFITQQWLEEWTLPQGSLLAFIGAPYFIYLMTKKDIAR